MKVKISYDINSKTVLPKEISVARADRVFTFHIDDEHYLSKITITADINNPEKFYSVITLPPNQFIKANFELKMDMQLYDSIIKDFQDLESLFSLAYNVKGINWNSRKYEVICESQEERENVKILTMEYHQEFPDDPVNVTEEQVLDALTRKDRLAELTVFQSFYREGKNEYHDLKYINAFYNFYFILEGMYGKGKPNRDVSREFKKSDRLRDFVQKIIDEHISSSADHRTRLIKMLKQRNMTFGIDAILELLLKTRGDLHHFTGSPNKLVQVTPFNHREFKTISFIAMGLALHSILYRVAEINIKAKTANT